MPAGLPVPFDWLDHTADVGVLVRGADRAEVYARVALVTATLIVGDSPLRAREERRFDLPGEDRIEHLVSLAGEVIYLWEVEAFLPARADVAVEAGRIRATLCGETFDPERHWMEREVKAATWHGARFERRGAEGWQAQLLFDL